MKRAKVEQADGKSRRAGSAKQFTKKRKARAERRAARIEPEVPPSYGFYRGYNT